MERTRGSGVWQGKLGDCTAALPEVRILLLSCPDLPQTTLLRGTDLSWRPQTTPSCLHRALDVLQASNKVHKGEQVKLHGNLSLVLYVSFCCRASPRCRNKASAPCLSIRFCHEVHLSWASILAGTALRSCRLAIQQTNTVPASHRHFLVQRLALYQDALKHAQIMLQLDPCWQVSPCIATAQQFS